jgi:2-polyprenyl-3-methyl-5-hydroxy-6-metoxy-1,4-benzoquinol methylase
MEYENYSEWKGWLTQVPFAELSAIDRKRFQLQLDKYRVPYKNINALEIGYGNGSFVRFLLDHGSEVEGVEVQRPLLEAAKARGIPVHSSIDEVEHGPYDLIVAFDVLEHLSIDQLRTLFVKCAQLLKEGGVMFFRFPNADSFAGMGAQNGDFTHITAIGQTKLQQLVEPCGFRIERFDAEVIYPQKAIAHAIRSGFRYLLMKAMGLGNTYFFSCNVVAVVKRNRSR